MNPLDGHASDQTDENGDPSNKTVCSGCGRAIFDRYMLKMDERLWHERCLRCCVCGVALNSHSSCFVKGTRTYCRLDYARLYRTKCVSCLHGILASDWILRARDNVYHLACFTCHLCRRQLVTGEEFILKDGKVLCRLHFVEMVEHSGPKQQRQQGGASSGTRRRARRFQSKRARTIFSEHQLQVLHANFNIDSNPDARDLERIAQITGLSKRVTQVWFQNTRARQRRQNAVLHQAFPSLAYSMNYGANLGQVAMHPYVDAALLSGGMMPAMQPLSGLSQSCRHCGFIYCHCRGSGVL